jgi:hypothetical protein
LWHPFQQELVNKWMPSWGKSFTCALLPRVNFWWVVISIGFVDVLLRKRRWLILAGWMTLYTLGYIALRVSAYWWYQLPVVFVLNLFFGLGIVCVIEILARHVRPRSFSLGLSALVTILLVGVLAKPTFRAMSTYRGDARGKSYTLLSRWFCEHTQPSRSIAFIEIGYLGYYTDNRIIDLAGLILPDAAAHIGKRDFAWSFWKYEPDYYVYLPDFNWALRSIRADPRFDQRYRPVATLPGPREAAFTIFERITAE